LLILGKIRRV